MSVEKCKRNQWPLKRFIVLIIFAMPVYAATDEAQGPAAEISHSESNDSPLEGRVVFLRCQSCHSLTPDRNGFGPSLAGVVGRRAGRMSQFNYSDAMRQSQIVWTVENLDRYLTDPQAVVPGNRMSFPGVSSPAERANLIDFLVKATAVQRPDS